MLCRARLLPLLIPHFSHRRALFLSIFSRVSIERHHHCLCSFPFSSAPTVSPSTSSLTVDFLCQHHRHLPPLRLPSTSAPISLFLCRRRRSLLSPSSSFHGHPPLFPLPLVTIPAVSIFLSTSDYYLDHRRRLPSLFLSPAPPSASRHHLPLLPLLRAHESSHLPLPPSPFPPPSTIKLLSPSSLSVAVIPTPSPSSPASTDADLPLLSLFSLLHLVGSLLLLPVTDPMSTSPSTVSLLPLQPSPLLAPPPPSLSSLISLSPPSPLHVLPFLRLHRQTPPRAAAASVAAAPLLPLHLAELRRCPLLPHLFFFCSGEIL